MKKKLSILKFEVPLWLQLHKVSRRYVSALSVRLGHLGIRRHYFLLLLIGRGKGDLTQQDLAEVMDVDKVSMVGILDQLVKEGFVRRAIGVSDRRERLISLTEKGVKALPEIRKGIAELNRIALAALPEGIAERFSDSLNRLKSRLERAEADFTAFSQMGHSKNRASKE